MSKVRSVLMFLTVVLLVADAVELFAEQTAGEPDFSIQKSEAQTVLYTVYRGPYEKVGKPIGELYGLAMQKKIMPRGPVALVYLNNPQCTSGEHYLTEIRIPVGEDAMQQAGTLGAMTDVKTLKPMDVAVMKKGPGIIDYDVFYGNLYYRIAREGYLPTDNSIEVFMDSGMGGDYSRMKSKIIVPVVKIGQGKK